MLSLRHAALLAASAVILPATAQAATMKTSAACGEQGTGLTLSGAGFTPDLALTLAITDDGGGTIYPESDGSFADYSLTLPAYDSVVPKTLTIAASDQGNAANNTSTTVQVAKYGSNFPVFGAPGGLTTWRFAGFPAGATVYGHFRYHNKNLKDYRFGTSSGPCGTLTAKAKRIPVPKAKHTGGWYVQVDTKPKFSFNTRPEYDKSFAVR